MSYVLKIALIGTGAGIAGTALGGFGVLLKRRGPYFKLCDGFSAGLMLSVVCFDLVPEPFPFRRSHDFSGTVGISFAMLLQESSNIPKRRSKSSAADLWAPAL